MALNTTTDIGLAQDCGCLYRKDNTAVVDNVFVFNDGVDKWVLGENKGEYRVACGGVLPGSDMTSRLQTIVNTAGLNYFVFDLGDITINGTLTIPTGKTIVFRNKSKLIGNGTLSGGIIEANYEDQIFATTLTVTPAGLAGDKFSAMWFGAMGDNTNDDTIPLQKAIDTALYGNLRVVYFPGKRFRITKGLIVRKDSDLNGLSEFTESFTLQGFVNVYGGNTGQTWLRLDATNSFCLGLQRVKGVRVKNIYFEGRNYLYDLNMYDVVENPAPDWDNGTRTNILSPHAGLVIDPFSNSSTLTADRYPGFESYYVDEGGGGSTDVVVEDCRARYFVVGFCCTPHGTPQNGDNLYFIHCWSDLNKVAASTGQSQNRSVYFKNFKCWGNTETVFDCRTYGDGTADPVEVDGLQIAGGVRYLCRLPNYFNKGLIIRNMHAELLYSLGGNFTNDTTNLTIEDSWVHIMPNEGPAYGTHAAKTIFRGGTLKVTNSYFGTYSGGRNNLCIRAISGVFENVYLDFVPVNTLTRTGSMSFKDCQGASASRNWGHNQAITVGGSPIETSNLNMIALNGTTYSQRRTYLVNNTGMKTYTRRVIPNTINEQGFESSDGNHIVFLASTKTLTNVNQPAQTADITFTANSDEIKKIGLNDFIYHTGTDDFGIANQWIPIGKVTAKNDGTGVVSLSYLMKGADDVTPLSNIVLLRPHFVTPILLVGNITSGSNLVTGCVLEENSTSFFSDPGIPLTITSKFFPEGTRFVSYDNGTQTVTLSNNANTTRTGVEIVSSDWQAEEYGGAPNPASTSRMGYKINDKVINTDFVTNPDVLYWICTKTGVTNTAFLPEFRAISRINAANGLNENASGTIKLGGTLTETTTVNTSSSDLVFQANGSRYFTIHGANQYGYIGIAPATNYTSFLHIGKGSNSNRASLITTTTRTGVSDGSLLDGISFLGNGVGGFSAFNAIYDTPSTSVTTGSSYTSFPIIASNVTSEFRHLNLTNASIDTGLSCIIYGVKMQGKLSISTQQIGVRVMDIASDNAANRAFLQTGQGLNQYEAHSGFGLSYAGGDSPTSMVHIKGTNGYNQLRMETTYTPSSGSDANGAVGDMSWDTDYLYMKTATGTWGRIPWGSFASIPQGIKPIREVSTNTTVATTDYTLIVDTSGGNITITMDPAVSTRIIYVKKKGTDANTVTITPSTGNIFADAGSQASYTFSGAGQSVAVHSNGTNLYAI